MTSTSRSQVPRTSVDETFVTQLLERMGDWFNDAQQFQLARLESKYFPYTHLFSALQVNRLRIKNRIVMGPIENASTSSRMPDRLQQMRKP